MPGSRASSTAGSGSRVVLNDTRATDMKGGKFRYTMNRVRSEALEVSCKIGGRSHGDRRKSFAVK